MKRLTTAGVGLGLGEGLGLGLGLPPGVGLGLGIGLMEPLTLPHPVTAIKAIEREMMRRKEN